MEEAKKAKEERNKALNNLGTVKVGFSKVKQLLDNVKAKLSQLKVTFHNSISMA